jgi:hypothetical protein
MVTNNAKPYWAIEVACPSRVNNAYIARIMQTKEQLRSRYGLAPGSFCPPWSNDDKCKSLSSCRTERGDHRQATICDVFVVLLHFLGVVLDNIINRTLCGAKEETFPAGKSPS